MSRDGLPFMRVSRTPQPTAVAPPEWVSGAVWVDELAVPEASSHFRVDSVHFAPGARTVWGPPAH